MPFSRQGVFFLTTCWMLLGAASLATADSSLKKPYQEEGEITLGAPVELTVALNDVFGLPWASEDVTFEKIHVCEYSSPIPELLDEPSNQDSCWLCVSAKRSVEELPAPKPTDLRQTSCSAPCVENCASDCQDDHCPCELSHSPEPIDVEPVAHAQPSHEATYERQIEDKELELQWKEQAMEAVWEARSEIVEAQLEAMEELVNLKAESLQNEARIKEEALEAVMAAREESFQTQMELQKKLIEAQSQVLRMQTTIVSLQQKVELLESQLEVRTTSLANELPPR